MTHQLASEWTAAIRAVIDELVASRFEEFEIRSEAVRLHIRRRPGMIAVATAAPLATAVLEQPVAGFTLDAPLAGIFYRAASPEADPFAREGDEIVAGQTVGLIEAMKVFNELRAERTGRVVRFLAENGALVQAGQPLMLLEEQS